MVELKSEWYSVDFNIQDLWNAIPDTVMKTVNSNLLKKATEIVGETKSKLTGIDHLETDEDKGVISFGVYN